MLFHNKYRAPQTPTIKIPKVEVQKFLQGSIKGGFSQIFHRKIPEFNEGT
jgi:hypothetical protein